MINKMVIQGRLTRDPELRHTQSGKAVASFTVAWSEKYKETERKVFLPCVVWGATAEMVSRYFSKGAEIVVEGQLIGRKWTDKDGNNRETIDLIADRVHFCGPKRDSGPERAAGSYDHPSQDFSDVLDNEELPF